MQDVEWKMANEPLKQAKLPSYEVEIEFLNTKKTEFFLGEILGVRYKVLEISPWLHFFGCFDIIEIECIQSDYVSTEKIGKLPTTTIQIQQNRKGLDYLQWIFWEKVFYHQKIRLFWVKSASIKSKYYPLVDLKGNPQEGSYNLIER